jgi:hypothetical protein
MMSRPPGNYTVMKDVATASHGASVMKDVATASHRFTVMKAVATINHGSSVMEAVANQIGKFCRYEKYSSIPDSQSQIRAKLKLRRKLSALLPGQSRSGH